MFHSQAVLKIVLLSIVIDGAGLSVPNAVGAKPFHIWQLRQIKTTRFEISRASGIANDTATFVETAVSDLRYHVNVKGRVDRESRSLNCHRESLQSCLVSCC